MGDDELLSGWGRSTWSRASAARPASVGDLRALLDDVDERGMIARGLGRSYGDQATNAGGLVVDTARIDDAAPKVEPDGRVRLHGGTSIEHLLRTIVPQGWFTPVSPGTRFVTIGGAIANDVHGKNHHRDGSIGSHVEEIELFCADGTVVRCSPDVESELFWATVGGMGLTGIIVAATLRLTPIPSSRLLVDTTRLGSLDALMDAMRVADHTSRYSVAWIDLVARGRSTGRSVLTTGDFAPLDALGDALGSDTLTYDPRQRVSAPAMVPSGLLRRATVRAFNEAWFRRAPRRRMAELQTISRFFHPLDGIRDWNRLYGRPGFVQWQIVVPDGAEETLREIVHTIARSSAPSFLAVLKRFGPPDPAPLSFPLLGWTLAADFPAGNRSVAPLLDDLDVKVAASGGRVYLAKDARLDPVLVPTMYPRLGEWRAVRRSVDPRGRWQSDLARRLGIL
jgi:decaprenylphospho-beta-D-ribofuranose 2-oxidase